MGASLPAIGPDCGVSGGRLPPAHRETAMSASDLNREVDRLCAWQGQENQRIREAMQRIHATIAGAQARLRRLIPDPVVPHSRPPAGQDDADKPTGDPPPAPAN